MIAFGYGISLDVEHLRFAAFDQDRTPESRTLIEAFTGNPRYFVEQPPVSTTEELDRRFRSGELQVALEIPPDFGRDILSGRSPEVAVWLDGSMPFPPRRRGVTSLGSRRAIWRT
jgi:ribosome-dependent ATPase